MLSKILKDFYIVKEKSENVWDKKNAKITKQSYYCKGYASTNWYRNFELF